MLRDLVEQETKWMFNKTSKKYYEMGDKPGKLLAGIIKHRNNLNYIAKMKDKRGELIHSIEDVTKIFQEYYQMFYKVNIQHPEDIQLKRNKIEQYLEKAKFPALLKEGLNKLDMEISKNEIEQVVKSIKVAKKPRPRWDYLTIL